MRTIISICHTLLIVASLSAQTKVDLRTQGKKNLEAGAGVTILGSTVTADDAVIPQYQVGSGNPVSNCLPGRDVYVDTTSGQLYFCQAANVWQVVPLSNHAHAASDLISGTVALNRGGTGQSTWLSGRCVQVSADGSRLESGSSPCGSSSGSSARDIRFDMPFASRDTASSVNRTYWAGSSSGVSVTTVGTQPTVRTVMLLTSSGTPIVATARPLPSDWINATSTFTLYWQASTTNTGNAVLTIETGCVGSTESFASPTFNAAVSRTVAGPGSTTSMSVTTFTNVPVSNCAAGEEMWFRLTRQGDDPNDTGTFSVSLLDASYQFSVSGS